jgi:hypothetical protein
MNELRFFREYSGVKFFPGAVINNQSYLGAIEAEDIFGEICNSNVKYLY